MELFIGKLPDELLNGELFLSLEESRYVLDEWRLDYNHRCPNSSLHWQTPGRGGANVPAKPARVRRLRDEWGWRWR